MNKPSCLLLKDTKHFTNCPFKEREVQSLLAMGGGVGWVVGVGGGGIKRLGISRPLIFVYNHQITRTR